MTMHMFEVTTDVCEKTGIVSFEMKWDTGNGKREDRGSFSHALDCEKYITSSKRTYIYTVFCKYVVHARVLSETGHNDFYRTEAKLAALDRCLKYVDWLGDKKLEVMCKVILSLEEDLRKILPSPNNSSYSSSESRIMDMIVFSKNELKLYPQKNEKRT